jgi:hypothetical protein
MHAAKNVTNISVGIESRVRVGRLWNRGSSTGKGRDSSHLHNIETQPASYLISGNRAVGACN